MAWGTGRGLEGNHKSKKLGVRQVSVVMEEDQGRKMVMG